MLNIGKKLKTVSLNSKFTGSDANSVLTVLYKQNTIKVLFPVVNLSYILLRVKALLDWLHSYQLMTAVSAVDQCQHQQENYFFFVSN